MRLSATNMYRIGHFRRCASQHVVHRLTRIKLRPDYILKGRNGIQTVYDLFLAKKLLRNFEYQKTGVKKFCDSTKSYDVPYKQFVYN